MMKNRMFVTTVVCLFAILLIGVVIASPKEIQSKQGITNIAKTSDSTTKGKNPADVKGPHPVIQFDEKSFDFGTHLSGKELTHTFVFHNKGDAPLIIEKVKAG